MDRVVRGVIGIWLLAVGLAAWSQNRKTLSLIGLIGGAGLLQNAVTGFCGGNWLFGIDTTEQNDDS